MPTIGLPEITGVRVGRHVRLFVDAPSKDVATEKVELACKKLLSNQIMESYSYTVEEA
jgi:phosphoribosylformylglycinamidine synthase subunit PurS